MSKTDPPALVDGGISLAALEQYARAFDSVTPGTRYTASTFVEWLELHVRREGRRNQPAGRDARRQRGHLAIA